MRLETCNGCSATTEVRASWHLPVVVSGRWLVRLAIGIVFVALIVYGELWAIRQTESADSGPRTAAAAVAIDAVDAAAASLPLAVLH